jgi:putative SOS response-associated peptidase YedK
MCGRYTIALNPAEYQLEFGFEDFPADFSQRYNVAPTQPVAVVTDASARKVEWMRWGLIPAWAKDPSIGARMINARSETLGEKPSFKVALQKRRCLLLADGFYEWQKRPGKLSSIPHYFTLAEHKPFVFAGLWEQWTPPEGPAIRSCTIITCGPNELIAPIHDRMPVILDAVTAWNWLNAESAPQAQTLLLPYPAEKMQVVEVSSRINSPAIDIPALIEPERKLF